MQSKLIQVGIVGCGRVAEHHLRFLSEDPAIKVVAVSDSDSSRMQALANRFGVPHQFRSLSEMLGATSLDALHVVTPPALHYEQAAAAIDAGLHVFVEKPAALSSDDVKDLYARADCHNVRLCPDFIQLFNPLTEKFAALIASGRFGSVIHVESFMGAEAALPELRECPGLHWSFDLPGGVLHNYITHPLYLTLNWIGTPHKIHVVPRSFGALPHGLTDHVEIAIEGERATASIVVSFAMSQSPFTLKVYCEKGSLALNFDTMSLVVHPDSRLPRPARRLVQSMDEAKQLAAGTISTAWAVLRKRVVPYQGLRTILRRFYASIQSGAPVPVPEDLVLNTACAEDFIAANSGKVHIGLAEVASKANNSSSHTRVLVTGASGFVGKVLVRKLVDQGFDVRAYVRPLTDCRVLEAMGIEIVYGDVRELERLRRAMQGIDVILHLAAGVRGSRRFACSSCEKGTENLAILASEAGVKRIVYISTMAIHDFMKLKEGECIRETSPLESRPELRSTYAHAKRLGEEVAMSHLSHSNPTWTIVRPSVIFGSTWNPVSAVGFRIGRQVFSLGSRRKKLRLIHVEDACDALIAVMQNSKSAGKILNLSHRDEITASDFVRSFVRKYDSRLRTVYIPANLLITVALFAEFALKIVRFPLVINRRRVAYLVRSNPVDGTALRSLGIWEPKERLREQLDREVVPSQPVQHAFPQQPSRPLPMASVPQKSSGD